MVNPQLLQYAAQQAANAYPSQNMDPATPGFAPAPQSQGPPSGSVLAATPLPGPSLPLLGAGLLGGLGGFRPGANPNVPPSTPAAQSPGQAVSFGSSPTPASTASASSQGAPGKFQIPVNYPSNLSAGNASVSTGLPSTPGLTPPSGGNPPSLAPTSTGTPGFAGADDLRAAIQDAVNGRPPDDPRVNDLYSASKTLREQAAGLTMPQYPGMSLTQALIGVAGALATQSNPHAQFVANYLPSLDQAIQQQYGSSVQGWQVARENLLNQADALARQAGAIQDMNLKAYQANLGYGGRLGVALANAQSRVQAAQVRRGGVLDAVAQRGVQSDDREMIRQLATGSLSAPMQGLYVQRLTRPDGPFAGIPGITADDIAAAANSPSGKVLLAGASGTASGASSGSGPNASPTDPASQQASAWSDRESQLRQSSANFLTSKVGLTDAQAARLVDQVYAMPPPQQIAVAKAQSAADHVSSAVTYQNGDVLMDGKPLDPARADAASTQIGLGMRALQAQSAQDFDRLRTLQLQSQGLTNQNDPDGSRRQAAALEMAQIQNRLYGPADPNGVRLGGTQTKIAEFKNALGALTPAVAPAVTPAAPTVGYVAPISGAIRMPPGASGAVALANQGPIVYAGNNDPNASLRPIGRNITRQRAIDTVNWLVNTGQLTRAQGIQRLADVFGTTAK